MFRGDAHKRKGLEGFNEYLAGLTHSWMKTLTLLAFLLVPLFIFLDYFTVPRELFAGFILYRIVVAVLAAIQYGIVRYTRPGRATLAHGYLISFAISLMIVAMTARLGGFDSSYYAGLNLIIIAINLLLPWRPVHSAANSVITLALYIGVNAAWGGGFRVASLINNLFFMMGTAVIAVSISYLRYSLARKEFALRMDLSKAQVDEIRELARVSQLVASGDLSIRIESHSSDTAGMLETSFDKMIGDLRSAFSSVKEISGEIRAYGIAMKGSAESMAEGAGEQLDQSSTSASMIRGMTETIIKNSEKALITDKLAGRSIAAASESGREADEAVEGIQRAAGVVKETAEKVRSLGQSSERINEVAQVISDIAGQTNLLALNAAIEAAHHGEEGRGFAIVAGEVGKLSERTTQATKEITGMIARILADIKGAVVSMEDARTQVDASMELVRRMHKSMREIIELSENLREMVAEISSSSGEESKAAESINENISSIHEIARGFAASVEDIADTAAGMSRLSENLEMMVGRFKLH